MFDRKYPLFAILGLVMTALMAAAPAHAAKKWGLYGESVETFDGKVVDILCELTGDCPANCGDGRRQLGMLKEDGKLVLVAKSATFFAGAVGDLLPYCGQTITGDGLLINNDYTEMFFIQFLRPIDGAFTKTNSFSKQYKADFPDRKGPWWKTHDAIKEKLDRTGILGIPGLEPEPFE